MDKKMLFLIFILLVSFVNANIDVLEYSTSEEKEVILSKMETIMDDLESLGYNSNRLQDIYDAAQETSGNEFFEAAAEFRDTTLLIRRTIKNYNELRIEETILTEHEVSDADLNESLFEAEENIRLGRYEDAQTYLDEAEAVIDEISVVLFQMALDETDKLMSSKELDNSKLRDIRERILVARDVQDLGSLDKLFDELKQVGYALQAIDEVNRYITDFQKWEVETERLEDIRTQIIFLYENERFNSISTLRREAEKVYNNALDFKTKYNITKNEVEKLGVTEFNQTLQTAYQNYQQGNFQSAESQIEELDEELIDYKTSQISSGFSSGTVNLWNLIKGNWQYIVGGIFVLAIVVLLGSLVMKKSLQKNRIKKLKEEKEKLQRFMKELQEKYYAKHNMSKKSYEQKFDETRKRFVEISKELDVLEKDSLDSE